VLLLRLAFVECRRSLKKAVETGTVKDRARSGRPSITTEREDCLLYHPLLSIRRATSRMLKKEFEDATGFKNCEKKAFLSWSDWMYGSKKAFSHINT